MGYLVAFVVALLLPLATLMGLNRQVGSLTEFGDLARIGRLATHDFARQPPPGAPPVHTVKVETTDPAVVVIGDSFSRWNLWQSLWMAQRGRRDVLSFRYEDIGGTACLPAWAAHLHQRYPQARQVIVQVVERSFAGLVQSLQQACGADPSRVAPVDTLDRRWPDEAPRNRLWPPPDPQHVLHAWAVQHQAFATQTQRRQVVVTPLARRDLFSSRRPDLLLTYIDDQHKRHWRAEDLAPGRDRLVALQRELAAQGLSLILVVVPDKSTVYAPYVRDPQDRALAAVDPWSWLQQAGLRQVMLRDRLQQAALVTRDLYMPDDTHLGHDGFRLLAQAIGEEAAR